jgi:hypothetical protein
MSVDEARALYPEDFVVTDRNVAVHTRDPRTATEIRAAIATKAAALRESAQEATMSSRARVGRGHERTG